MKTWHKWLFGLIVVVTLVLWQLPARLLSDALPTGQAALLEPRGTLWSGSGIVLANGQRVGRVHWSFAPSALLSLRAAYDLELTEADMALTGRAAAAADGTLTLRALQGNVGPDMLARLLARYDISPTGTLAIERLDLSNIQPTSGSLAGVEADGRATWSGGDVRYVLSGYANQIDLPALQAQITTPEQWPQMRVTEASSERLLMTGRLTEYGTIAIGITRGLTRLAGQTWPTGEDSDNDQQIVLEVEERLI
ncbi:MAG: type II secretion system protein N [Pseudomonadota bacterium]